MTRPIVLLFSILLLALHAPASGADDGGVTVVDQDIEIGLGIPDEIVFSPPRLEQIDVPFALDTAVTRVVGTLSWPSDGGVTDIDFEIVAPDGGRSGADGQTGDNPEIVEMGAGPAGGWVAQVYPFTSVGTTAHLTIVVYPAGAAPLVAILDGDNGVGELDLADYYSITTGGMPPYTFEWDTDGDGVYVPGAQTHSVLLPTGVHEVRVRATDSLGAVAHSSRMTTSYAGDHDLWSVCGGWGFATYWALEYNQTHDTCWVHDGHHTYFYGDTVYALREIHGYAFAVEQQFAPGASSDLPVEISMDGLTWTQVGSGHYEMLPPVDDPLAVPTRQEVHFDITGADQPFRYVRVHAPPSLSQGLSGYLDHTDLHVVADEIGPAPAPTLAPATRALTCEQHIMERFFDAHPCTYGGIDRWDSASFYHTYVLGDGAVVDRVQGSFVLAPFRTDDFFLGSEDAPEQTAAYLITSEDGRTWTLEATIPAIYGEPASFDVALDGREARFVRLFPQYHAFFDDTADEPSLHHPRAFFVTSAITVDGLLPT